MIRQISVGVLFLLGLISTFGQVATNKTAPSPSKKTEYHVPGAGDTHKPEDKIGRIPYLDFRNGFLDAKFGSSVGDFREMALVEYLGALKIYKKANEIKELGQATVQSCFYEFYDGKLMSVDLTVTGQRSSDALLRLIETAYGKGIRPKPLVAESYWTGHVASAHYVLLPNSDAFLRVSNIELDSAYGDYEKKAIDQDAQKL
jgi:hypothetical protein